MTAPERPEDMIGKPLPDVTVTDARGEPYSLRRHVGEKPFALFFLIHVGSPG